MPLVVSIHSGRSLLCSSLYTAFGCTVVRASDISVSKINLVSIIPFYVLQVFLRVYCISVLKYFSISVSVVSFQIILISVFISVSGFIILINKSITLILEL